MKDHVVTGEAPIRAAERTLDILRAMNVRSVSTIGYLHEATGLPKATLVRFLSTLVQSGYVTCPRRGSGYQLTSLVRTLSSGYHGDPLITEAGRRIARKITEETKWPLSIALPTMNGMVVRLSTAADSPMSPFHSTINMHLGFFLRALGRAYIAFCGADEISRYVRQAVDDGSEGFEFAADPEALCSLLASIRSRGYAVRDILTEPRSSDTVAVPIFLDGQVRATLGMTFFRSAMSCEAEVERMATRLKEASRRITEETVRLRDEHRGLDADARA